MSKASSSSVVRGAPSQWRNRVTALEYHVAGDILDHPHQWRTHPAKQSEALRDVLAEVGVAGAMLVYRSARADGALVRIDGHGRKDLDPAATWPCLVLDVDDREADLLLATYDPISAAAGADAAKLDGLLREVSTGSAALQAMLAEVAEKAGMVGEPPENTHKPSHGYDFRDIHAGKLAYRVEAAWRADGGLALDLYSGQGQLAEWYARRFGRVVRVDRQGYDGIEYVMNCRAFLDGPFAEYALAFDLVDFDDEGSPLREVVQLFERIPTERRRPFVLCLTDGSGLNLKVRGRYDPGLYLLDGLRRQATSDDYYAFEGLVTGAVERAALRGGWTAQPWASARGSEGNVLYQTYLIRRASDEAMSERGG